MRAEPSFVVAAPMRSACDDPARFFAKHGLLRLYATWNRRGTTGIPVGKTRLMPALGLIAYIAARLCSFYRGEAIRFALYPLYDQWVKTLLRPGDHMLSSYAMPTPVFGGFDVTEEKLFWTGATAIRKTFGRFLTQSICVGVTRCHRWHLFTRKDPSR